MAQGARGLGPLSDEVQRGMYVHPTYVVTPKCEPLGIVDVCIWAREMKGDSGRRGGSKVSLRWTEGYARLADMAPKLPDTRMMYVADREADRMSLMKRAQELGTPVDWLVRAMHNRCLPDGEMLWAHSCAGEAMRKISFEMPPRHGVKARTVQQQLRPRRIELPAGKGRSKSVTCIVAREFDALQEPILSSGVC